MTVEYANLIRLRRSTLEKPDFVANFIKPEGTEIKHIGNGWYLYNRSYVYDPNTKRSRKKSGKIIGKITPDGLVPSKRNTQSKSLTIDDVAEVAIPTFLWDRTRDIRLKLKKLFPDMWEWIYVTVLLRIIDPYLKRLESHYEHSFLSHMFPGLRFDARHNAINLEELGKKRDTISEFMKSELQNGSKYIIIDGHRLITSSRNLEYAEIGYDSKQRYQPQTNILYVFSADENGVGLPSYYKQYLGSTLDMKAFTNLINETQVKNSLFIVVADKGFSCIEDFEVIKKCGLKYVIPLKRGNYLIKGNVPNSNHMYDNAFTYNNRSILYKVIKDEDSKIIIFHDNELYSDEFNTLVKSHEKEQKKIKKAIEREEKCRLRGTGVLSDKELEELKSKLKSFTSVLIEKPEIGTITLKTNLNESPEYIYRIYKQRQKIEQFFKTYVCCLDFDASYMRNRTSQESWCFLNHIAALIAIDLLNYISDLGLGSKISLEDIRKTFGHITANRIDGIWKLAPIKKTTGALLSLLKFELTDTVLFDILKECNKDRKENIDNIKNTKNDSINDVNQVENKSNKINKLALPEVDLGENTPEKSKKCTDTENIQTENKSQKPTPCTMPERAPAKSGPKKAMKGATPVSVQAENMTKKTRASAIPEELSVKARARKVSNDGHTGLRE